MAHNYTPVARKDFTDTGYGFAGYVELARRADGTRWRMEQAGFRWVGNEGGYHVSTWFGTLAEARDFWRSHFESGSPITCDEFFAKL